MGFSFAIIKMLRISGMAVNQKIAAFLLSWDKLMQKIHINSWLTKQGSAIQFVPGVENELELDFSNVNELSLNDIEAILILQRFAVFNETQIRVENMKPCIKRVFEQTGLYKMINSLNPVKDFKIKKRQGLAFD